MNIGDPFSYKGSPEPGLKPGKGKRLARRKKHKRVLASKRKQRRFDYPGKFIPREGER